MEIEYAKFLVVLKNRVVYWTHRSEDFSRFTKDEATIYETCNRSQAELFVLWDDDTAYSISDQAIRGSIPLRRIDSDEVEKRKQVKERVLEMLRKKREGKK